MSLAEALAAADLGRRYGGVRCGVCEVLEELDDVDRAALVSTLAGRAPSTTLSDLLRVEGYPVSQGQLARHRRGGCRP